MAGEVLRAHELFRARYSLASRPYDKAIAIAPTAENCGTIERRLSWDMSQPNKPQGPQISAVVIHEAGKVAMLEAALIGRPRFDYLAAGSFSTWPKVRSDPAKAPTKVV